MAGESQLGTGPRAACSQVWVRGGHGRHDPCASLTREAGSPLRGRSGPAVQSARGQAAVRGRFGRAVPYFVICLQSPLFPGALPPLRGIAFVKLVLDPQERASVCGDTVPSGDTRLRSLCRHQAQAARGLAPAVAALSPRPSQAPGRRVRVCRLLGLFHSDVRGRKSRWFYQLESRSRSHLGSEAASHTHPPLGGATFRGSSAMYAP